MWTEAALISGGLALLLVGYAAGACSSWCDREDLREENKDLRIELEEVRQENSELQEAHNDATSDIDPLDNWGGSPSLDINA